MIIKNCKLFNGKSFISEQNLLIDGSKIKEISSKPKDDYTEILDASGYIVCPGFIDIHTHGISGYDIPYFNIENIDTIIKRYAENGTTTFLPSVVADSKQNIINSIKNLYQCRDKILGVHLEGPFINKEKKGAQNERNMLKPSVQTYNELVGDYDSIITRVNVAPELDKDYNLIKYLYNKGKVLSFGHTVADSKIAQDAFSNGITIATHMFSAMPGIHHREPYITGQALLDDTVYCEIIPDLIHMHPDIIKLLYKVKGRDKIVMVSDSISASGLKDGIYNLGGIEIYVKDHKATIKEGNLAGSIVNILDGIKNFVSIGINLEVALQSATYNPACAIQHDNHIGMLEPGYDADILILNNNLDIVNVIIKGKVVI